MSRHREEISAMLARKLRAFEEFRSLTGQLRAALESDETETVSRCVERREALMRDVEGLDRRIARQRRSAPADECAAINRVVEEASGELGEKLELIVAADRDCAALAAQRQAAFRNELAAIRKQRVGLHGYAPQRAPGTPKFLNVQT